MLTSKFIHFLRGYVEFTAWGGFPERFINLCANHDIPIRDVIIKKGVMNGYTSIQGYRNIRPYAKRSGMKVRLKEKRGLPFIMHKLRHRVGLLMGAAVFFIVVYILSGMIWTIQVQGNNTIPTEDILASYEEVGIKIGTRISGIDASETALLALKNIDGITWSSINFKGCTAVIEVKEKVKVPDIVQDDTPSNIVASRTGQILVLENYKGSCCTEIGSGVEEGDVIVSGAVENKNGSVSFCHADAYVTARTKHTIDSVFQSNHTVRVYSKPKSQYRLFFFGLNFPINFILKPTENFDYFESTDFLEINKIKMPVGIIIQRYIPYETVQTQYSSAEASLLSLKNYIDRFSDTLQFTQVETQDIVKTAKSGNTTFTGNITCIENIMARQTLDLDNSQ